MITHKTMPEEKQGKLLNTFGQNGNRLVIKPWNHKTIAYTAPIKEFVEKEIPSLIDFANNGKNSNKYRFIHPLIIGICSKMIIGHLPICHCLKKSKNLPANMLWYIYREQDEHALTILLITILISCILQ